MKKRGYIIFSIIGFMCSFFSISGIKLEKGGNIIWTGSFLVRLCGLSLVLGLLVGIGITTLFIWMEKQKEKRPAEADVKKATRRKSVFGVALCGNFLAWLPCFLAFYPGNCTYDIGGQTWYIVSGNYEAHHPIAHTLLMEFFLDIGTAFENVNLGMAFYVLFQMICLAGAFTFGITFFYTLGVSKKWLIALQIWSMFFIPNWYMGISTTKDVIFSAAVLVMLLCLYKILLQNRNEWRVNGWDIAFLVTGVLMVLFRNNGKYALSVMLVFALAVVVFSKKNRKLYARIALGSVCILLAGNLVLSVLSYVTNASDIRKEEMFSVPIQQFSRVMNYRENISEEYKKVIDGFILEEAYEKYIPSISDPVKEKTNVSYLSSHLKEFVCTYFEMLVEYPGDFINAVLALDAGYLNPFDQTHEDVYTWGASWIRVGWSPYEELGLSQTPVSEKLHRIYYDFADSNAYADIPVLGWFVMPGGYLWLCMLLAGWLLWKKKYAVLFLLSYIAGYYITLLLGPTVQLRYVYTVMIVLPYMVVAATQHVKKS